MFREGVWLTHTASWGEVPQCLFSLWANLSFQIPLSVSLFDFHECSPQQPGSSRLYSFTATTELRCVSGTALGPGHPASLPAPSL